MSSEHITYMGRAKCFLTYSCLALAMRGVFVNSVALQTRNANVYSLIYTPDLFMIRCIFVINALALLIS